MQQTEWNTTSNKTRRRLVFRKLLPSELPLIMNEDAKCPQFVVMGQYQKAIESFSNSFEKRWHCQD